MRDLQAKGGKSGDGGNRTREPFPPSLVEPDEAEKPAFAGHSREQWLYRFYDVDGSLLYIGVTQRGEERFADHRKRKAWWPEVAATTRQVYGTRADVLTAERHAIYREKPKYNIVHAGTGRRLYGEEPIPASEPLTAEAAARRSRQRILVALYGPLPDNVVRLSDRRRRPAHGRRPVA
jgi:predicted GIY-YIG superfamily endonuclease